MTGWQSAEYSRPRQTKKSWLPACCSSQQDEGDDPRMDSVAPTRSKEEGYMSPEMLNVGSGYGYDSWDQGNANEWVDVQPKEPEAETSVSVAAPDSPEAGKWSVGTGKSAVPAKQPMAPQAAKVAGGEDFETTTGLSLISTKLERCMLKDHELPLADVLQAKVCAIRAMAEATAAYRFENAKQLKHLRDALAVEQTALWARLAQAKELHQAITARVAEAVEIEDFDKAEEVYELQRLAEDCIKGFELDESQGGSADLTSGAISLGTASSLGLLEGDFTVEFWMRCHDVANQCPLLTGDPSSSGSFPSLYAKPGGGIQLDFAGGSSYSSRMRLQQTRRWTHVAFSFSFSATDNDFKVIIYQDGLQVEFGSEIWAINVDSEIRLGPFPGKLAEFRIWDHARAAEEVETWMSRRCKGDEPGLACCLSLRPARGLSDSTLDPEKALAAGHFFSDRGQWDGQITWDGDCPSQLLDPGVDLPYELVSECPICSIAFTEGSHYCRECGKKRPRKQVKPDTATISDPWSDQSLLRAWQWLDSSHETKVGERRRMVERRQLESETRQEGERQRKAYLEWQEQQRQQEEMEAKLKAEEEEEARQKALQQEQQLAQQLARRLTQNPLQKLASWTCPFSSY